MNRTSLLPVLALLVATSLPQAQSSGARDRAMGGTGVASSSPYTAGFVNPALLTGASDELDFGLVLPFFDVAVRDQDELVDAVDEFQDTLQQVQGFIDASDFASANALRPTLAAQLQALDNRTLFADFNAGVSVVVPLEDFKLGVSMRSYVDAQAFPLIDPADIAVINDNMSTSADLDNLQSEAVVLGAGIAEVGLSVATDVELFGLTFAVGVTPKFQSIETYNYSVQVVTFEDDDALSDLDDEIYRTSDEAMNLDLGVAVNFWPNVTTGLAISNVFRQTLDTMPTGGRTFTYELEPKATAGIAYNGDMFTLAADLELTPTNRFSRGSDSQLVHFGAEMDLADWVQLRGGFVHDLEDVQQDLLTAGFGLSPFAVVRLDFVGMLGDNAAGAGFQLSVTL